MKALALPTNFKTKHSLYLLHSLKEKLTIKQSQYKNYYTFTQILHSEQDPQKVIKQLKKNLYKIDKKAFIMAFEVINKEEVKEIFFKTNKHYGVLHLHCLIYSDKQIDVNNLKNAKVKQNFLKSKEEYEQKDSTIFLDYIFTKHHIYKIYHNSTTKTKKIKAKIYTIFTYLSSLWANLIQLRYKGQGVLKYAPF